MDIRFKNQHFVTEAYIKAWCDVNTPDGAFVWHASKKYRAVSRKSPRSLCYEPDIYTVYDSQGNRMLELEHKVKDVEDKFISLRDNKLFQRQPLLPDDRKTVALFLSTMFARTEFQKRMQQEIWQEWIDKVESLPTEVLSQITDSEEYKTIVKLRKQPMPFHLFHFVNVSAPILYTMNCAIYETTQAPGFITSDNPCIWIDPAIAYAGEPVTWFGLGSSKLNVILPISPNQCISLKRQGLDGYLPAREEFIEMVEGFEVCNSTESIITNQKLSKESWFD